MGKKKGVSGGDEPSQVKPEGVPEGSIPTERPSASLNNGELALKDQPNEILIRLFTLYFFVAGYFNRKQVRDDEQWSADDPNVCNLVVILALGVFVLSRKFASDAIFGTISLVLAALIFSFGFARQFTYAKQAEADSDPSFVPHMWKYAALIHLYGAAVAAFGSYRAYTSSKLAFQSTQIIVLIVAALAVVPVLLSSMISPPIHPFCGDWAVTPPFVSAPLHPKLRDYYSRYIELPDGVRLAADIHLPNKDWEEYNSSFATTIILTRHGRNVEVLWPFNKFRLFSDKDRFHTSPQPQTAALVTELVQGGYAVVVVDVRGSGSSTGIRYIDSHPRELDDYRRIVRWTVAQKWCDGRVTAAGVGYGGRAVAQMAARGGVAAVAMLFASLDQYGDEVAPGGIPSLGYLSGMSKLSAAVDRSLPLSKGIDNRDLSLRDQLRFNYVYGSVAHVDGWEAGSFNQNSKSYDAATVVERTPDLCKDDVLFHGKSKNLSYVELEDRHQIVTGLRKNKVHVLAVAGYYAGRTASEQSRLYRDLIEGENSTRSQLLLGPWAAGGTTCYDPSTGLSGPSQFPLAAEVRAYFDCVLSPDNCESTENSVSFFITSKKTWSLNKTWPPSKLNSNKLFFGTNSELLSTPSDGDETELKLPSDSSDSTTGLSSRWNYARSVFGISIDYRFVRKLPAGQIHFTSDPLKRDRTVVGSITVELMLNFHDEDAAVFVYIDDIASNGSVSYVTEGQVRAGHPILEYAKVPVGHPRPFVRMFKRGDLRRLNGLTKIQLALETIAHTFVAGHRIRVSVAAHDKHNYMTNGINLNNAWSLVPQGSSVSFPVQV